MVAAEWNEEKWKSNKKIIRGIEEISLSVEVKTATDSANKTTKVVGRGLEKLSVKFSTSLGTGGNPEKEQKDLHNKCGKSAPFYCGEIQLGENDFILTSVDMKEGLLTPKGDITAASFELVFLEDGKKQEEKGTAEAPLDGLIITYEGENIGRKIAVKSLLYTQYVSSHADVLEINFNDVGKNWDKWDNGKIAGTEISVECAGVKSGKMFIHSCSPKNGVFELRALSVPLEYNNTATKSWEKVTLEDLAKEIAEKHGLTCKTFSTKGIKRKYVAQNNTGDFSFLGERCKLEGAAFVVYNGDLNLYDEKTLEAGSNTLEIDIDDKRFTEAVPVQSKDKALSEYTVKNGRFSGSAKDDNGGQVITKVIDEALDSDSEAKDIAAALLRNRNKGLQCIEITTDLQKGVSAGSVLKLKSESRPSWNGVVFVYKVRHNFMGNKSKIWARKPLDY